MAIKPYVPKSPGRSLVNSGWNARPPVPAPKRALPGSPGWGAEWGWTGSADPTVVTRATQNQYSSPYAGGGGMGGGGGGRWISPDYSGILASFSADARARFGAGQAAMEAQRLSQARSAFNRLGSRKDVPGLLEKLQAFGLTQSDIDQAEQNPWSELKALDRTASDAWSNTVANRAARGGFRSGGTIASRERIDQDKARNEAMLTQDVLSQLSEGQFAKANWEREQRDAMEQAIANQQAQLAAAYQPYWSET